MSINLENVKDKLNLTDIDMLSPVKILESISTDIEKITGGLVKGIVSPYDGPVRSYKMSSLVAAALASVAEAAEQNYDIQNDLGEIGYEDEKYDFCLVAPSLPNYKYRVLFLSFGIGGYPVELVLQEDIGEEIYHGSKYVFNANNRSEYETLLESIFSSRKVISVIQELINAAKISQEKSVDVSAVNTPENSNEWHGRKFCVSDIRQSQEWRCGNRAKIGLNPLRTITPEVRSGMRAVA